MPHVTEQVPKISTRLTLTPPWEFAGKATARQTGRQAHRHTQTHTLTHIHTHTDTHTHTETDCPKPLFATFWRLLSPYRASQIRSYREVDFLHHANTSMGHGIIRFSGFFLKLIQQNFLILGTSTHSSATQGNWAGAQSGLVNVCTADKIKN